MAKRKDIPPDTIKKHAEKMARQIEAIEEIDNPTGYFSGLHPADENGRIAVGFWLASKQAMIKKNKELFVLNVHTHKIWQQATGKKLWMTYVRNEDDALVRINSTTYDGIINKLYVLYSAGTSACTLKELWPKVVAWKSTLIKGKSLKIYDGFWKKYYYPNPISDKRISQLRFKDWNMFFDNLVEEHQLTEKQYSNIRTVANYIASYCLKHDIIDRNPIRDLEGIRYNFKKTAAYNAVKAPHFSENDMERIKEWADKELCDPKKKAIYPLAMKFNIPYGLRVGELGGLYWSDIDFKEKVITVQRQYVVDYQYDQKDGSIKYIGKVDMDEIKGHEEPRQLPLTDENIEILNTVKALNIPGQRIFQMNYNTYERKIKKSAKELNIPIDPRTHSFRVTAARNAYSKTGDVKVAQSLLGHTTPGMTFKYIKDFDNMETLRKIL